MKYLLFLLLIMSVTTLCAQPRGINYQAVIRDMGGEPLANQTVDVFVDISANGGVVYAERFTAVTTDEYGLLQLKIGGGANQGIPFFQVDWTQGEHYLELRIRSDEVDITLPSTQFQAVPYALVAETTEDPHWERGSGNAVVALGDRVGIGTTSPTDKLTVRDPDLASIRVQTEGASDARIDLLRGIGNQYTDWRVANDGGMFSLSHSTDAFAGGTTAALSITSAGRFALGDFTNPQDAFHLRGAGSQRLRVESTDGTSGVGFFAPGPDFRIVNTSGQLRLLRSTNNFASSTEILDVDTEGDLRIYQNLNMANQQIVNVGAPTGGQHVVNRNYLEDFVEEQLEQKSLFPSELSSEATQLSFVDCSRRCRLLEEDGFFNWGLPSMEQISQFAGAVNDDTRLWTSTGVNSEYGYAYDSSDSGEQTIRTLSFIGRLTMQLNNGEVGRAELGDNRGCRCVR
jgi:hypothetical protein